jgi:hypothetical protein
MDEHVTAGARTATEVPTTRRAEPPSRVPVPRRGIASLVAVLLVGAAVGYVLGYEEYSSRAAKAITPPACAAPATASGSTRLTGTVRSADGTTLVVDATSSAGVPVALDAASICRTVGARADRLRPGQEVTVVGTPAADGTVVATQVVVTSETRATPG